MSHRARAVSGALALGLCLSATLLADEKKPSPPPAPTAAAPPAAPAPAEPAKPKITLKWSTASEVDNYGFFVFRGDEEKGPWKPLNERIISGAGNSDVPRSYQFEDLDVVPGKAYFYFLESVSTQGVREKFSPVIKKECCKGFGAKDGERPASDAKPAAPPAPGAAGTKTAPTAAPK